MGISMKDLEKLKKLGKIRGYQQQELKPVKVEVGGRVVTKHWGKKSAEKDWLGMNLLYWCNERCLSLEEEYRFLPHRKFRFDWCIPAIKVAVEYEGIFSGTSRHTNKTGYSKDAEKYSTASIEGWTVLRYTALNYKNSINDLNKIMAKNGHL